MSLSRRGSASPGQNAPRGGSSSEGPWVRGLMEGAVGSGLGGAAEGNAFCNPHPQEWPEIDDLLFWGTLKLECQLVWSPGLYFGAERASPSVFSRGELDVPWAIQVFIHANGTTQWLWCVAVCWRYPRSGLI